MHSVNPKTGRKVDEHLHAPILDGVKGQSDREHRHEARKRAGRLHQLTDKELDTAYGKDSR